MNDMHPRARAQAKMKESVQNQRATFKVERAVKDSIEVLDATAVHAVTEDNGSLVVQWKTSDGSTHGLICNKNEWDSVRTRVWEDKPDGDAE